MKYEPLIVHLFKLFSRTLKLKPKENEEKIPVTNNGKPYTPAKDYDEQGKAIMNKMFS